MAEIELKIVFLDFSKFYDEVLNQLNQKICNTQPVKTFMMKFSV